MTTPADLAALRERGATHALLDLRERGAYERGTANKTPQIGPPELTLEIKP